MPDMVVLGQLENLYGPVPFDHKTHVQMAEMSGGCVLCHHHTPDGQEHSSCRSCHATQLADEDPDMPGLRGAYHRQCLSCHQEWSHDTGCSSCHVAKPRHQTMPGSPISTVFSERAGRMPAPIALQATFVYQTPHAAAPVATFHHADHTQRFGLQCVDCHRDDSCSRCHDASPTRVARAAGAAAGQVMGSCTACHSQSGCLKCHDQAERPKFDHALRTGWPLSPPHAKLECCQCHGDVRDFATPTRSCHACHAEHRRVAAGGPTARTVSADDAGNMDCLSCHADVRDRLAHATTVHGPAHHGDCKSCHDLSSPTSPRPSADRQSELCLRCHSRAVPCPDGRSIPSAVGFTGTAPHQHRPVREGRCTACHDPHGSGHEYLLVRDYPQGLYAPFAAERYALCLGCHDAKKFLSAQGTAVTGFRDGEKNLHAVHVNKEKGRTCSVCHDVHASKQPFRIRDRVPFGDSNWSLPINFEKTRDGGSCAPGCHSEESYDRNGIGRASNDSGGAGSRARG